MSRVLGWPLGQRKHTLFNHVRYVQVIGDCTLVLRNVTWEDEGEFTCTYEELQFKYVASSRSWIEDCITRKGTLVITTDFETS